MMKSICIVLILLIISVLSIDGFLLKKNGTSTKDKGTKSPKKGKNLIGDIIYIHKEFVPTLKLIDNIAKQCSIKLSMKGSYEQLPDPTKVLKFTTANAGKHLQFIVIDKTGKNIICNKICLAKEGEKIPQVKCLITGLRKENLRYGPHNEVGSLDDASDAKPGFSDIARRVQEACKGVKL